MAVTKAMRMQQIVSGFVKDDQGNVHSLGDIPRLEVLEELLADLTPDHKVIVWAVYHENYRAIAKICQKLKIKYVELHGGVDNRTRLDSMEEFRTQSDVRVAIANQRAAGVGVNLIEAQYAIYYSKGYSLEDQLQSETRNFRGGSAKLHKTVFRINLVAEGTIDQVINEALDKKLKVSQEIIDNKEKL
jgi:non-specific serine/threonine protein kinase